MKINPGDFQEVDLADMFHMSETQSERLVHWQMTTIKFKSQMIFGQKCLVCSSLNFGLSEKHTKFEKNLHHGLLSKYTKHEDDCANLCVLLRKSEL